MPGAGGEWQREPEQGVGNLGAEERWSEGHRDGSADPPAVWAWVDPGGPVGSRTPGPQDGEMSLVADTSRPAVPRTAVVTGAGRGIGAGLAAGLAAAGYDVALLGRTRAHLDDVAARIQAAAATAALTSALTATPTAASTAAGAAPATARRGPHVVVVPVELTDAAAVREAASVVQDELGGVGLLVHNAGVIERAEVPFDQDDVEDTWRVIETNVRGPLLLTHALLPGMLAQGGGRIVNINSGAGHRGAGEYTGYGISKGALARMTTMLDTQYRDRGLRVFDLAPGVVRTDMTRGMPAHDARVAWTPIATVVELLVALADGGLDALAGRFVRAGMDTPASLAAHGAEIIAVDARRLRLVAWGASDPLVP